MISLNGDNIAYARALTELEGLRNNIPAVAVAAGGNSLIRRIQHMLKTETTTKRLPGFGLTAILIMAIIFTAGLGLLGGATPSAYAQPDKSIGLSFESDDDDLRGYWEIDKRRGKYQLEMDFDRGDKNINTFTESQLMRILTSTDWGYMIERDAGTFYLVRDDNSDDDIKGNGKLYFKPNSEYVDELKNHGVKLRKTGNILTFAIHNIRLDFIRGLAELGYDDLSRDELISMHIHDVTPDYIRDLEEFGYDKLDTDQLVSMQIHDVTIDYISELKKLGYNNIHADQLVSMQIHDVEPDFISEFNELGYEDIDADQLVSMRIHDVNPDLVHELNTQGVKRVSLETLVSMQIHNVTPRFIEQLAELGYTNIKPTQLVSMKIHNVTPKFIKQLEELGVTDVDIDNLIAMCIHNVTPRYIKRLRAEGIKTTDPEKLVSLKIHGF
ncbi:MAG: hypothetical protein ABIE07_07095 [Candidatus Zixiibacteriota bacterium]